MDQQEEHAARKCSRDIQYGHAAGTAAWTCCMVMQHGYAGLTCGQDILWATKKVTFLKKKFARVKFL
jgi:hypothetical protein